MAVQGVGALAIGILILFWPGITLQVLLVLIGGLLLLNGLLALVDAWRRSDQGEQWWPRALEGAAGVVAAVITFFWTALTAVVLLYVLSFWALAIGILTLVAGIQLRSVISGWWIMVLVGALSIILGILLLLNPAAGALAFILLIGGYFAIIGVLLIIVALMLRSRAAAPG